LFLDEIEEGIRKYTVPEVQKALKVAVSELEGHAVTTGAAKMAWDKFMATDHVKASAS
jgi:hypothetical protein